MGRRNPVARYARRYNKATVEVDRKRESRKRGPEMDEDEFDYLDWIDENYENVDVELDIPDTNGGEYDGDS